MPFDLVPEPPPDVRSALDRLLERESTSEERQSAWWLAGIQEAVGDSDSEEP